MDDYEVVVVGGGLAGLAAALKLRASGRSVLVIERGSRLGGKTVGVPSSWGAFSSGPTSFQGRHREFWEFLDFLGLSSEAILLSEASKARMIVRDGRLHVIKPSPWSVLRTEALTRSEKRGLFCDLVSRLPKEGEASVPSEESLDAFLGRRFGRSATDHFFAAVFSGIFAGDLKKLSASACVPALVEAERTSGSVLRGMLTTAPRGWPRHRPGLYGFRAGLGAIGTAAASRLAAWTDAEVLSISLGKRPEVALVLQGIERSVRTDAVVVAIEAPQAAHLLSPILPKAAAILSTMAYAPVSLVHWVESHPGTTKLPVGFGWLAPPIENRFALGTLFVGDLYGEEPRRFTSFVGGAMNPERASSTDAALFQGVGGDLRALTGGRIGSLAAVTRWTHGVYQPTIGHAERLAALQREVDASPLVLAGSYLGAAAMKDAIASGFAAAGKILARSLRQEVA